MNPPSQATARQARIVVAAGVDRGPDFGCRTLSAAVTPQRPTSLNSHFATYGRGAGVDLGRGVACGRAVGIGLGVELGVTVGVELGVALGVTVAVAVGVAVGVPVAVGVGEGGVPVAVGVGDGGVPVAVGVGVGVGCGPPPTLRRSTIAL